MCVLMLVVLTSVFKYAEKYSSVNIMVVPVQPWWLQWLLQLYSCPLPL